MKKTIPLFTFVFILATNITAQSSRVDSAKLLNKANTIQIANYKPPTPTKAKDGGSRLSISFGGGSRNGKDGKDGKDGDQLSVYISAFTFSDSTFLKIAIVTSSNHYDTYYINPMKGSLTIIADGGDGGKGGNGEHSNSKIGGDGGKGGDGGDAGNIIVQIDSSALAFAECKCIDYWNSPGMGGQGGRGGAGGSENGVSKSGGINGENGKDGKSGMPIYIKSLSGKTLATKQKLVIPFH